MTKRTEAFKNRVESVLSRYYELMQLIGKIDECTEDELQTIKDLIRQSHVNEIELINIIDLGECQDKTDIDVPSFMS